MPVILTTPEEYETWLTTYAESGRLAARPARPKRATWAGAATPARPRARGARRAAWRDDHRVGHGHVLEVLGALLEGPEHVLDRVDVAAAVARPRPSIAERVADVLREVSSRTRIASAWTRACGEVAAERGAGQVLAA